MAPKRKKPAASQTSEAAPPGTLVPLARVERSILLIRGQRVIVDADLAELYGVSTKALNQAVKRNAARFPDDFMFRLTTAERSEVVTNCDHLRRLRFSPQLPSAFTEHGAIMAATVLNSPKAIQASLFVVRAFVKLREVLANHRELAARLDELEGKLQDHDGKIIAIIDAIRHLMAEPPGRRKPAIGYHTEVQPPKPRKSRKT
jgi:hypothetical protein